MYSKLLLLLLVLTVLTPASALHATHSAAGSVQRAQSASKAPVNVVASAFGAVSPSLPEASGSANLSTAAPAVSFDEQLGESFTQNFTIVSYNITAVSQTDSYGYGPAYLVNGLTEKGYWYQVGVSYDWPYLGGGYDAGFHLNYEVYAPNVTPIFPSGQGGVADFNGAVNNGDEVLVRLVLNRSTGKVYMSARDLQTGASAAVSYSSFGASTFVGSPYYKSNSKGFFTGLMTEWYHVSPFYGAEHEAVYSEGPGHLSSGWLWVLEFNVSSDQLLFYDQTPFPLIFNPPSDLHEISDDGATEYANATTLVTGAIGFTFLYDHLEPVFTDAGLAVNASISLAVAGGSPPFSYRVYLGGSVVEQGTFSGYDFNATLQLGTFEFNSYYLVTVSDSTGQTISTPKVAVVVNPDPSFTVHLNRTLFDVGQEVYVYYNVSGGTPPFNATLAMLAQPKVSGP
ncbi:MAG: hypothetical protein QXI37_01100, partial [Thermoprotei archaeon]